MVRRLWYVSLFLTLSLCACGKGQEKQVLEEKVSYDEKQIIVNEFEVNEYFDIPVGESDGEIGVTFVVNGDGPESFCIDDSGKIYILDKLNKKIIIYENGIWLKDVIIKVPKNDYDLFSIVKRKSGYFVLNRNMGNGGKAVLYTLNEEGERETLKVLTDYDSIYIRDMFIDMDENVFLSIWNPTRQKSEIVCINEEESKLEMWSIDSLQKDTVIFIRANNSYSFDCRKAIPNLAETELAISVCNSTNEETILFTIYDSKALYICRLNFETGSFTYLDSSQDSDKYGGYAYEATNREFLMNEKGEVYWMSIYEDRVKMILLN